MKKFAQYSLIIANLVPIPGILFLDWNLFSVLFFYWLESAVVGVYNIPKMILINPTGQNKNTGTGSAIKSHKLSGIIFFIIHYSGFMAGHGFFIFALFSPVVIKPTAVILGLISLGISHGISFVTNYIGHKEYEKVSLSQQMIAPYRRIILMHLTIILCGFLLSLTSMHQIILIFLVILKIAIDLIVHFREHSRLGTYLKNWFTGNIKEETTE